MIIVLYINHSEGLKRHFRIMLKDHKDLIPVNEDATIWRYMDFATFYSLLVNKALFFKRLDKYSDEHEGNLPPETVNDYHANILGKPFITKREADEWIKKELQNIESFKPSILSNSWNLSNEENYAMWKIYLRGSNEGVAIQTTVGKLRKQLAANTKFKHVYSGKISYEPIPWSKINQFTVSTNKRKSYAYETEYRALLLHEMKIETDAEGNRVRIPNHKFGTDFEINPEELIDKICISPFALPWFEMLLKVAVTERLPSFDLKNVIGSEIKDK